MKLSQILKESGGDAEKGARLLMEAQSEKLIDYEIQIKATVTKTILISAANEDEATELAHQEFTVACEEGEEENYNEETLYCKEAE